MICILAHLHCTSEGHWILIVCLVLNYKWKIIFLQKCRGIMPFMSCFWGIWSSAGPRSFVCEMFSVWKFVVFPLFWSFSVRPLCVGLSLSICGYSCGPLWARLSGHSCALDLENFLKLFCWWFLSPTPGVFSVLSFWNSSSDIDLSGLVYFFLFFFLFSNSDFLLCFLEISWSLSSNLFIF